MFKRFEEKELCYTPLAVQIKSIVYFRWYRSNMAELPLMTFIFTMTLYGTLPYIYMLSMEI